MSTDSTPTIMRGIRARAARAWRLRTTVTPVPAPDAAQLNTFGSVSSWARSITRSIVLSAVRSKSELVIRFPNDPEVR